MPAWLRRLLSKTYRNALAAEASGEYVLAAEQYALAGLPAKVAEMHLVRAKRVLPADRANVLDDALRWLTRAINEDQEVSLSLSGELAAALLEEAQALTRGDPRQKGLAVKAAELHEGVEDYSAAGAAYEFVGQRQEATRCYEAAGDIEAMERLLEEESRSRASSRATTDAFDEYETALAAGARGQARRALRRCCAEAPGQGYERMLSDLERRFPTAPGAVEVRVDGIRWVVVGTTPAFLGRGDAQIRLRHAGISRRHAAIDADPAGFHLRDAGSRNGTLLGGLPLAGRVPLAGSGILGLGDQCTLQFQVEGEAVELEVLDGPDRGLRAVVILGDWRAPGAAFRVTFSEGLATVIGAHDVGLVVNGSRTLEPVNLLIGDTIEAPGGGRIEVLS